MRSPPSDCHRNLEGLLHLGNQMEAAGRADLGLAVELTSLSFSAPSEPTASRRTLSSSQLPAS